MSNSSGAPANTPLPAINGMTYQEMAHLCRQLGAKPVHARRLFTGILRQGLSDIGRIADLPQSLRDHLRRQTRVETLQPISQQRSSDGTAKLLFRLADGHGIESVLIPASGRLTLCLSTQAGCALGCRFCLTARSGLARNLQAAEMVAQVQTAQSLAPGTIRNLVLMGMGEPLHNYEQVARFVRIATDPHGMAFAPRRLTLSTAGTVPGIYRMIEDELPCNLAVSLNATTDKVRSALMPIGRRYPLAALTQAMRDYTSRTGKRVLIAYVLMANVNDGKADARRLAGLLAGIPCTVNLLPFNAYPGSRYRRPDGERVSAFRSLLIEAGYVAVVRESRGPDILAACGQLQQAPSRC